MRFTISSGTELRPVIDRRDDARAARDLVMTLVKHKRPNVRIHDGEGRFLTLATLERLASQEATSSR
jgi:hypothetical protein